MPALGSGSAPTYPGLRFSVTVLIDAPALGAALSSATPPAVLDVRWVLGDARGRDKYLEAHIPGAVYVDLATELAGLGGPTDGRHPLPEVTALQASARTWGVTTGQAVVVYDNSAGLAAARAWWLLRWAGVADVRILDGGLGEWLRAGHDTAGGNETPAPGNVVLTSGLLPVLTLDEAAALPGRGLLLDARAGERYRGEVEPIDPRAGHIPGAVSAPTSDNLNSDGTFCSPAQLRARFHSLGAVSDVGVYCGSGVTAAHEIAALAIAGVEASLFPGSWSAWTSDPDRPVETGPGDPSADAPPAQSA